MRGFLPWWVAVGMYAVSDALQGRWALAAYSRLRSSQHWTQERLRKHSEAKLARLLHHARDHTQHYGRVWREAGLPLDVAPEAADLAKLPFLSREEIRANPAALLSDDASLRGVRRRCTGGSTGTTLTFHVDRRSERWREAATFRWYDLLELKPAAPCLSLWGSPHDTAGAEGLRGRLQLLAHNKVMWPATRLSDEDLDEVLAFWRMRQPAVIVSFTSILVRLARHAERRKWRVPRPARIVSTAETLTSSDRKMIEENLRCPVLNQYGSREFGLIAMECLQGRRMHITSERVWVEHADLEAAGHREIIITDLDNYAFPFIRYRTGDLAGPAPAGPCPCGRRQRLLGALQGRRYDLVRGPNGRVVGGTFFSIMLRRNLPAMEQFQVIQLERDRFLLRLRATRPTQMAERSRVEARLRAELGGVRIEWEQADELPALPSGKHRYVVALPVDETPGDGVPS